MRQFAVTGLRHSMIGLRVETRKLVLKLCTHGSLVGFSISVVPNFS